MAERVCNTCKKPTEKWAFGVGVNCQDCEDIIYLKYWDTMNKSNDIVSKMIRQKKRLHNYKIVAIWLCLLLCVYGFIFAFVSTSTNDFVTGSIILFFFALCFLCLASPIKKR